MADYRISRNAREYGNYGITVLSPAVVAGGGGAECRGVTFEAAGVDPAGCRVLAFHSLWGREFTPQWHRLDGLSGNLVFEVNRGRSSHGYSPVLWAVQRDGCCVVIALCHSGNWRLECTPEGSILFRLTEDMLKLHLAGGEAFSLPAIIVGRHPQGIDAMSERLTAFLNDHWLPSARIAEPIVEWNHWWAYEDTDINEEVFRRNADAASELGCNLCTLDAGWFGDAGNSAHWTACRGDWDLVNAHRFPSGIRALSDYVHGKGMKFGIWMEPEGMGASSRLRREHPEWEALRDCAPLPEPYLCLAADGAEDWLFHTIERTVRDFACDWIKLDFNVDAGFGCNRGDHGHQPGTGLYHHVIAYYRVLDRLHARFPNLLIESCSSGGLRFDLEMLRHVDASFLSDPDDTAHSLQCFHGASLAAPAGRLLHWAWSQTHADQNGRGPFPAFSITDDTPDWAIRFTLRAAMLHLFGVSRDLTGLPERARDIFRQEITLYRNTVFTFIMGARLYRLSGQPLRQPSMEDFSMLEDGREWAGCGRAAYEFFNGGKGIVFIFQLDRDGSPVRLRGLNRDKTYRLEDADSHTYRLYTGGALMDAGLAPSLQAGECVLLLLEETKSGAGE